MQKDWRPIFEPYHLSPDTLTHLERSLVLVPASAGKILQLEGDECRGIYWVLRGELIVFRIAPDGRELVLQRLSRKGIFNLVPAFEEPSVALAAVRAVKDSQCLWLPLDTLPHILRQCPDFSTALLKVFAQRLHSLTTLVEQIGLHGVRGRLAQFLIDIADGKLPARQYTQDEMAAQIGTVRDMVGRTLRNFEDAGLIRRDRNRILLRDRPGLENEANK
jgi:CRP-like cAMP-binding protein